MHTILLMVSLALAFIISLLHSKLLHMRFSFLKSWGNRRMVQVAGILLPVLVLGLGALVTIHFLAQVCFMSAPPLDITITLAISIIGALGLIATIILNVARAVFLPWHVTRHTWEAPLWLREMVMEYVREMDLRRAPRTRVAPDVRPWALVAGLAHPTLVVSSGLVALLDKEELEAVLCHELAHIRRGDLWWVALAGAMHDLTWFLPSTRRLYRALLVEQEVACDDHVLGGERRLALAGALARIWKAEAQGANLRLASSGTLGLLGSSRSEHFEERVQRLMRRPDAAKDPMPSKVWLLVAGVAGAAMCVIAQLWTISIAMEKMGCSLHSMS